MEPIEVDRWHGAAVAAWQGRWGLPALRVFRRLGSTNDLAREMAEADTPAGSVVIADEQTSGRGQRGRVWISRGNASLSMSMVIRPRSALEGRVLTLRLGLAAARAIEDAVPVQIGLKWPNDLVARSGGAAATGKIGGILCESSAPGGRIAHVIAGIGLNLRRPADGWGSAEVDARATSLDEAAGTVATAPELAGAVAAAWLAVARSGRVTLSARERDEFDRRDVLRDREVAVEGRAAGTATGISHTGALLVRTRDGTTEISAGTVRALHTSSDARP